jgi:hypothetical protein
VLADVLGYSPERIRTLAAQGAVAGPDLAAPGAGRGPLADRSRGE